MLKPKDIQENAERDERLQGAENVDLEEAAELDDNLMAGNKQKGRLLRSRLLPREQPMRVRDLIPT